MEASVDVMTVNGVEYIRKGTEKATADTLEGMDYCIVRTYSAGVFAGYVSTRAGKEVVLKNARRLWYWKGAASLSQLAVEGVKYPEECKFPCEVPSILLTEAVEVLSCTEGARLNIAGVPVWTA